MTTDTLTRTWSKTTTTGKTVAITITMSDNAWRTATATIDGKTYDATHSGLGLIQPQTQSGVTVVAAIDVHGLGRVGLTQAEYDSFRAVVAEQDAAMQANPTLPVLIKRRKNLSRELGCAIAEASDGAAYRFDRYDNGYSSTPKEEAAIAQAKADLAEFDAAHPEVIVEIEAQRDRDVEHFLAVD